ncbi:MAG: PAC2 family protein [Actinomycetota bacterium]|nr:PAC2 family protein [Actinomycetota bacterium]
MSGDEGSASDEAQSSEAQPSETGITVLTLDAGALGELRSPVMLVAMSGWFDVAAVATGALRRISATDSSVIVGEIDPDPFFDFTVERPETMLDDHGERHTVWPATTIRVSRQPSHDLVLASGVEPHLHWHTFAGALVATARRLGCRVAVTVGASAEAIPHTRMPPVVGSTTSDELADRLGLGRPTYQGVTGLIGVLLARFDLASMPAVSLRVGVPHYLADSQHPKSSAALVRHLSHVLGDPLMADFSADITEAEQVHANVVQADPQLAQYVTMLEAEFDRRAEAAIPSPDELGRQFEEFLRDQPPDNDDPTA